LSCWPAVVTLPGMGRGTPWFAAAGLALAALMGARRRPWLRGSALCLGALLSAIVLVLARPAPSLACSCVPPVSLAQAVTRSPDLAVFVGKVVALDGGAGGVATIAVDGRFRGPLLPSVIRARYGGGGDCTIGMSVGERRLITARLAEGGVWFPAMCDPQGVLGTPEGGALLAESIRTFGPAQPVGEPPTEPTAGFPLGAAALALGVVAVLGIGFAVMFVMVERR
jgi:hypothetical protein